MNDEDKQDQANTRDLELPEFLKYQAEVSK